MSQLKRHSALEIALNYISGFFIAWATWHFAAAPLFDIEPAAGQGLGITALFTAVSVVRSYFWRRVFNWLHREGLLCP